MSQKRKKKWEEAEVEGQMENRYIWRGLVVRRPT
jgi:hypothetical protein